MLFQGPPPVPVFQPVVRVDTLDVVAEGALVRPVLAGKILVDDADLAAGQEIGGLEAAPLADRDAQGGKVVARHGHRVVGPRRLARPRFAPLDDEEEA